MNCGIRIAECGMKYQKQKMRISDCGFEYKKKRKCNNSGWGVWDSEKR